MRILGLHANTHESGCALLEDGRLCAAVSQERLDRRKMSDAPPIEALDALLAQRGLSAADLNIVAISDDLGVEGYYRSRRKHKRALLEETFGPAWRYYLGRPMSLWHFYNRHKFTSRRSSRRRHARVTAAKEHLQAGGFAGAFESYEHGYNHACAAYYGSGFDSCLIFVMEGASFRSASSVYLGRDGHVHRLLEIPWPHSPGVFYATATRLLGFTPVRHEGKIMGLAGRGDASKLGDYARGLFRLDENKDDLYVSPLVHLWWWDYRNRLARPDRPLPAPLRDHSREDIAAAWQLALEEGLCALIQRCLARHDGVAHVALAGGVHANVKLNQRINELPGVEGIHVHPAMGDSGQPIGAALASWAEHRGDGPAGRVETMYLGPTPDPRQIDKLVETYELTFQDPPDLPTAVAELLAAQKVVAVCCGPMEFGPRALGNRSILYAATDPSVNDWLNRQLRRTEFMPLAPMTLAEQADACYANANRSADAAACMTLCYDCTEAMKRTQPAVVHVDGTARPQLLARQQNPFCHDVLTAYHRLTGHASVVNTSLNMHEEPIACSAEDALRVFVASNLDAMVLGDRLLLRQDNPALRQKLNGVAALVEHDGTEPDTLDV